MKMKFFEIAGWYGAIAILVAFFLISFSYVTGQSVFYQVVSLTGALGLMFNAYKNSAYPNATLNIIYALIAVVALVRIII